MELSWQLIIKIFILFSLISDYLPNVSAIHEQETWTLCKSKRFRFGNFILVKPDFLSLHSLIEQILNSSPYPGALQKFRAICRVRAAFHKTISEFSSRTLSK